MSVMASNVTDLLYEYDDFIRGFRVLMENSCEGTYVEYISRTVDLSFKLKETRSECKRLNVAISTKDKDIEVLNAKLVAARKMVDTERNRKKAIENERDALRIVFEDLRRILLNDPNHKLPDDTREKITSLSKTLRDSVNGCRKPYDRLNTIAELESSQSNLSSISISRSEDGLDESYTCSSRKHRPSHIDDEQVYINAKKRKSECFLPVTPSAPRAESLESLDSDYVPEKKSDEEKCVENVHTPGFGRLNTRSHSFVKVNVLRGECCLSCEKNIRMLLTALKCTGCNAVVHRECHEKVPLPCVPMGTPSKSGTNGTIADYAPLVPPMIPAIVIHCINEVERRKVKETGIYRIPAIEKDVRALKEKFLKGKGAPQLSKEDIHTVCCCLKDFLRNLRDPLIPQAKWDIFAKAVFEPDKLSQLYQAVSALPQANRETLAFIILHLQRVACSPSYKMPIPNLATVFGPTIVGRSKSEHVDPFQETQIANTIMEELLKLSPEFWARFIDESAGMIPKTPSTLRNTPSTESLMRKTSRKLLTPGSKKRFFNTPPLSRNNDS